MPEERNVPFKPRARLLSQLGDQLIRNEKIALFELVKNAYDAEWYGWLDDVFSSEYGRPVDSVPLARVPYMLAARATRYGSKKIGRRKNSEMPRLILEAMGRVIRCQTKGCEP